MHPVIWSSILTKCSNGVDFFDMVSVSLEQLPSKCSVDNWKMLNKFEFDVSASTEQPTKILLDESLSMNRLAALIQPQHSYKVIIAISSNFPEESQTPPTKET